MWVHFEIHFRLYFPRRLLFFKNRARQAEVEEHTRVELLPEKIPLQRPWFTQQQQQQERPTRGVGVLYHAPVPTTRTRTRFPRHTISPIRRALEFDTFDDICGNVGEDEFDLREPTPSLI